MNIKSAIIFLWGCISALVIAIVEKASGVFQETYNAILEAVYGYEALLFWSAIFGLIVGLLFGSVGFLIGIILSFLAFDWEKAAERRRDVESGKE